MKTIKGTVLIMISVVLAGALVSAGEDPENPVARAERALDKLLLDTPHVYIQSSHRVNHFTMPEDGIVFTGEIMLDPYSGVRRSMQWAGKSVQLMEPVLPELLEGLSGLSELANLAELAKLADVPELQDADIDFEKLAELSELGKLSKLKALEALEQLESLEGLEALEALDELEDLDVEITGDDGEKVIIIRNGKKEKTAAAAPASKPVLTDAERLDAFKVELVDTLLTHAKLFAESAGDGRVTVVLQVRDEDFVTTQGAGYLRTRIPARKLLKLKDASVSDPEVMKAFRFNW